MLQHRPPADYAEFLAQRVEVNYFAAAALIPQRWAVAYCEPQQQGLEIEDLRDRYLTSYEMAAHRFTNLATIHLDIPVHFMKTNKAGIIYKAYANDGVTFPADSSGAVEGQRVCRFWTARRVFEQPDGPSRTSNTPIRPAEPSGALRSRSRASARRSRSRSGRRTSTSSGSGAAAPHTARSPAVPIRRAAPCHRLSSPLGGRRRAGRVLGCTPSCWLACLRGVPRVDQTEVMEFLDQQ